MSRPLLVEYFQEIPEPAEGEAPRDWEARMQTALEGFHKKVSTRYNEGTLQHLLGSGSDETRRAATLALGLTGTMDSNAVLAGRLHDHDSGVRSLAADALWSLWFRADTEENNRELQRLIRVRDRAKALAGLDALIQRAPDFAEAYNQRAVVYFKAKEYQKSIGDCEKTLQLNPCHFGACSGLAQCYMSLKKQRAALKAFRETLRINPNLQGIEETIRELENVLGDEGQ